MSIDKEKLLLYAISDRKNCGDREFFQQLEDALEGGITILQLREKNMEEDEFVRYAVEVKKLCDIYGVPLIINDNLNVALKAGADGVHVGAGDMPVKEIRKIVPGNFIIGATAKTLEQARRAYQDGADYLGVGAVFPSSTKPDAIPVTMEILRTISREVPIPVAAIGGIDISNIEKLRNTGISGVALVSGVFGSDNVINTTKELKRVISNLYSRRIKKCLTIAGSDSGGGAGIQADIKTMIMNGVYAMSAITALTAQNTMGVFGIQESSPEFLRQQIRAVFDDIFPDSVKIGMVSSSGLIDVIGEELTYYGAKNVVVDPVMVSTSGARLMKSEAINALKRLLPMACVVTPNIPEAEILGDMTIGNRQDMEKAARVICHKYKASVLIKGGHSISDADDYLYDGERGIWYFGERIDNPNTHGTGCTLSSAISANLAKGYQLETAVRKSKEYISGALKSMMDLGHGAGPLNHGYILTD